MTATATARTNNRTRSAPPQTDLTVFSRLANLSCTRRQQLVATATPNSQQPSTLTGSISLLRSQESKGQRQQQRSKRIFGNFLDTRNGHAAWINIVNFHYYFIFKFRGGDMCAGLSRPPLQQLPGAFGTCALPRFILFSPETSIM